MNGKTLAYLAVVVGILVFALFLFGAFDGCGRRTVVVSENRDSAEAAIASANYRQGQQAAQDSMIAASRRQDAEIAKDLQALEERATAAERKLADVRRSLVQSETGLAAGTTDSGQVIEAQRAAIALLDKRHLDDSVSLFLTKRRLELCFGREQSLVDKDESNKKTIADLHKAIGHLKAENAELQPDISDNKIVWMIVGAVAVVGAQQVFK